MTIIQKFTGYNEKQQADILFRYFVKYCAIKAKNDAHLQALLTDKRLWSWFLRQAELAQNNYLNVVMQMKLVRKHIAVDLYHGQMHAIFNKYNKRILANKPNNNKPLTLLN